MYISFMYMINSKAPNWILVWPPHWWSTDGKSICHSLKHIVFSLWDCFKTISLRFPLWHNGLISVINFYDEWYSRPCLNKGIWWKDWGLIENVSEMYLLIQLWQIGGVELFETIKISYSKLFFTRGQFWPSDIPMPASLCVCQRRFGPRDNLSPVKTRVTAFEQEVQKILD